MPHDAKPPGDDRVPVHGHERVVAALTAALACGRAPQACLLVGPPLVGRRTVARHLAQWLFCPGHEADRPCGACRSCRLVAAGTHPDLLLLDAPLKIEAARELQHRLSLAPVEAERHVAVLPDVDRASLGAANSLLKTLEEPPPGAVLLLTAATVAGVLPTIRSRCQSLSLRPLPAPTAEALLQERLGLEPARAELLSRLSGGRLGWAVRASGDPALLEERSRWLDRIEQALASDAATRLRHADAWARQKDALGEGLALWLGWWRDVLLVQHGLEASVVNVDRLEALRAAARRYPVEAVVYALRSLDTATARLRGGASADLAASVILMELPT